MAKHQEYQAWYYQNVTKPKRHANGVKPTPRLPKVTLFCKYCHEPFQVGKCFAKNRKYCSHKCFGLGKTEEASRQETKFCTGCKIEKKTSEFNKRKSSNGTILPISRCKKCQTEATNKWRSSNPELARLVQNRATKNYLKKLKERRDGQRLSA